MATTILYALSCTGFHIQGVPKGERKEYVNSERKDYSLEKKLQMIMTF